MDTLLLLGEGNQNEIQRQQELLDRTVVELKEICQQYHLKQSKYITINDIYNINLDGKKEKLVKRIVLHEKEQQETENHTNKVITYLQDKKRSAPKTKPLVTQHYRDTFNVVDMYDQQLGYLPFKHTLKKRSMVILINLLKQCAVNARTIWCDLTTDANDVNHEHNIKDFVKEVVDNYL